MKKEYSCRMLGWEDAYSLAEKVAKKITRDGYVPDHIIGITRGGWVPAVMLSDLLGVKDLLSMRVEHWGVTAEKDAKAVLKYPLPTDLSGKKILLVDDLTDTGDSIALAIEEIRNHKAAEVRTATLIHKKQSRIEPDYYAKKTGKWEWIILPWNINEDLLHLSGKAAEGKELSVEATRRELKKKYGLSVDKKTLERVLKRKGKIWVR
ncbi:MAG: phosphoribosyltransferase [Candidatus Altiarchaeia archaeon]